MGKANLPYFGRGKAGTLVGKARTLVGKARTLVGKARTLVGKARTVVGKASLPYFDRCGTLVGKAICLVLGRPGRNLSGDDTGRSTPSPSDSDFPSGHSSLE